MIDYNTLITLLQDMTYYQLGQFYCQGCGYEHNCDTEGCAILRDAVATMEQLYKDCTGRCECCAHSNVPCDQPPCDHCFDARNGYQTVNWQWRGVQKEAQGNGKVH